MEEPEGEETFTPVNVEQGTEGTEGLAFTFADFPSCFFLMSLIKLSCNGFFTTVLSPSCLDGCETEEFGGVGGSVRPD